MLFHFDKSEICCRTHGNNNNDYKRKSEKNPKFSWFLGAQKFNTSQKSSQTHITLIWDAPNIDSNYFQLVHIYWPVEVFNLPGL